MKNQEHGRTIHLGDRSRKAIELQLEAFRKKFGRDPAPGDPVFFDPDKGVPTLMSEEQVDRITDKMTKLLLEAVPGKPELAYAYKKTGIILTEENAKQMPKEYIREFEAAAQEYRDLAKNGRAPKII